MAEIKNSKINSQQLIPGFLIFFFSLIISILLPLITPVLGLALLVSGIYYYRHSIDASTRTIAIAAIISGIIVILIAILVLSGIATYTTTSSSIENYPGVMPSPPNKTI